MHIKKILLALLCYIPLCSHAEIINFKPTFQSYDAKEAARSKHKVIAIGTAQVNKTMQIPIFAVEVPDPIETGMISAAQQCKKPHTCQFTIAHLNQEQASQFKILIFPGLRAALIPKTWQVIEAAYGVNGSAFAKIMSPKRDEVISMYNSSICVGCGMPNATLYFPELIKQSLENDFGAYKDPNKYLTIVHPNKNLAFFSYQIPNYPNRTHGIATYDNEDTFNFQDIEVSLQPEHKDQARFILNLFQSSSVFYSP